MKIQSSLMKITKAAFAVSLLLLVFTSVETAVLKECPSQRNATVINFSLCTVRNFSLHLPVSLQVERVLFLGAKVHDTEGCIQWLRQLPTIRRAFIIKVHRSGEPTEGLADCLSRLPRPLQYADPMEEVSLEGLDPIDEKWLNKHGHVVFSNLANKTVSFLSVSNQRLETAITTGYLPPVTVTGQFHLMTNAIPVVNESDFNHLNLSNLRLMCLQENGLCVLPFAAFRNMNMLNTIQLDSNPLHVPWKTLLRWRERHPKAILVSHSPECEAFVAPIVVCRVLQHEFFTDKDHKSREVMLIDPDCSEKPSANLQVPQPTRFWIFAVVAACVFGLLLITLGAVYFRAQVNKKFKSLEVAAVRFQRSMSSSKDEVKGERFSGTYEEIVESTYEQVDFHRTSDNEYCEPISPESVYEEPDGPTLHSEEQKNSASPYSTPSDLPAAKVTFPRSNDYKISLPENKETTA